MQIYFINFFDGDRWLKDNIGQEIEDIQEVIAETRQSLIEMSKGLIFFKNKINALFEVINGSGNTVYRATLFLKEEIFDLNSFETVAD